MATAPYESQVNSAKPSLLTNLFSAATYYLPKPSGPLERQIAAPSVPLTEVIVTPGSPTSPTITMAPSNHLQRILARSKKMKIHPSAGMS